MGRNARLWTRGVINQDLINAVVPLRDDVQYRADDTQRMDVLFPTMLAIVSLRLLFYIFTKLVNPTDFGSTSFQLR